ncbi:MAG: F-box protein [Candidatus Dojkabacteria bacterium]|nr:F-box protein [Candidatus Dojkabacteria bacterium]
MNDQQSIIKKLPNEIIYQIINKLELKDFINFSKTCKKFKNISNDEKIFCNTINYEINKISNQILEILKENQKFALKIIQSLYEYFRDIKSMEEINEMGEKIKEETKKWKKY